MSLKEKFLIHLKEHDFLRYYFTFYQTTPSDIIFNVKETEIEIKMIFNLAEYSEDEQILFEKTISEREKEIKDFFYNFLLNQKQNINNTSSRIIKENYLVMFESKFDGSPLQK